MAEDPSVYVIGEGVPDPKGIFGTTLGLQEKYGKKRVFDMPVSENGMTGIALGSAIVGMKPILIHQRVDFSMLAMDQVINNVAKWYSMYGGQHSAPMVIKAIIGQGWGQGNQHSQNLQNLYAHIPGLKVVMPSNAYDGKGLLVSAVRDKNPVIILEHRWVQNTFSEVPQEIYEIPIGKANRVLEGKDVTIVSWSYWALETQKTAKFLKKQGVSPEIIDIRSLSPLDFDTIRSSLQKTGALLVVDGSWRHGGFAGEIISRVVEDPSIDLKTRPRRITFPHFPSPSTPGLTKYYYPTMRDIFKAVGEMLSRDLDATEIMAYLDSHAHDVPDKDFTGPF